MNKIETILQQDKLGQDITQQPIIYKGEVFTYFDTGNTRHVFVNKSKTKVIKLVKEKIYRNFNDEENEIYQNASATIRKQFAKTTLTSGGLVIEQEFCNPIKLDDRPLTIAQMLFANSCRNEVGWTADGRLVCFDLDEYKKY